MSVLVDMSIWSLALRRKPSDLSTSERGIVLELAGLVRDGRARLMGLIRQELLSGIKSSAQFEALRTTLSAFPDEPVDTADYEAAAKAGNECRAKGVVASTVDILICAVARRRGLAIFTTDPDFERYARVLAVKLYVMTETTG